MLLDGGLLDGVDPAARLDLGRWPRDAAHRAGGHRQPARPAGPGRPGGAPGRRRGRRAVLGRCRWRRRWGGRWSGSSGRWTACNAATWCTSSPPRRWPASPSTGSGTSWCATSATSGCPGPSGCCATSAPPTGWRSSPTAGSTTWPRCWPTIAGRPTRSPGPSGWTPPRTPRRRGPRCTGRPAGRTSCTRWTPPPTLVGRALALDVGPDPALELFDAELAFYPGRRRLPGRRGARAPDRARRAADRERRPDRRGARLDAARHRRLESGRPVRRRCTAWTGRSASTADLPDSPGEGGRPAGAGPGAHAQRRDRAGVRGGAGGGRPRRAACSCARSRPTPGSPWRWRGTWPATPQAFAELAEVTEHCRVDRLTSRRRAVQNLAWASQEEGDLAGSARLVDEQRTLDLGGGHSLATSFADQWARCVLRGSTGRAGAGAWPPESTRRPTAEWDLHIVAVSGWMRGAAPTSRAATPQRPMPGRTPGRRSDVERASGRGAARRSGFHRVLRSTLAHAALCRAVQGRRDEAMRAARRAGRGLGADPDDPVRRVGAGGRATSPRCSARTPPGWCTACSTGRPG